MVTFSITVRQDDSGMLFISSRMDKENYTMEELDKATEIALSVRSAVATMIASTRKKYSSVQEEVEAIREKRIFLEHQR